MFDQPDVDPREFGIDPDEENCPECGDRVYMGVRTPRLPFVGVVVSTPKGKALDLCTRGEIAAFVAAFELGERLAVTVKRYKATRSQKANAYLWGVVYELMAKGQGRRAGGNQE